MKFKIVKIGKPVCKEYDSLVSRFEKRLKSSWKVENILLKESDSSERMVKSLSKYVPIGSKSNSSFIIGLDERGEILSSPKLAKKLNSVMESGIVKEIIIVIGGPFGLPDELKSQIDFLWSFSKAVFPSDLAWVMTWEQVYRANAILRGSPYHHV